MPKKLNPITGGIKDIRAYVNKEIAIYYKRLHQQL